MTQAFSNQLYSNCAHNYQITTFAITWRDEQKLRKKRENFSWCGFADATPRASVRDATRTQLESSPRKPRASVQWCGSTKANPRKHVYVGLQGGKENQNERGGARKHSRSVGPREKFANVCTFREFLQRRMRKRIFTPIVSRAPHRISLTYLSPLIKRIPRELADFRFQPTTAFANVYFDRFQTYTYLEWYFQEISYKIDASKNFVTANAIKYIESSQSFYNLHDI